MEQYKVAVGPLIGGDRCGKAFYDSFTIILAGTFSTGRRSEGGRCADVTITRGCIVLILADRKREAKVINTSLCQKIFD